MLTYHPCRWDYFRYSSQRIGYFNKGQINMQSIAIVGAQWGDEGKGKITDLLSNKSDLVVRFQGGHNAGHTIWVGDSKFVLHLIPSGILHEDTISIVGHGVVFNPHVFLKELDGLQGRVKNAEDRLKVSGHCNVITSYHQLLDVAREENINNQKIGTTGRGIGPAYEDKAGRISIKVSDLLNKDLLYSKLKRVLEEKEVLFKNLYKIEYPSIDEEMESLLQISKRLEPFITDTFSLINNYVSTGKKILYEGAQGVLLDVDYGTYPYVTSSNTSAGGVYTGASLPGKSLDEVLGITKAYVTRVGSGPFPTELFDEFGDYLGKKGHEFGATTGRKRRCGVLDLPLLRYSVKASNITSLALTKTDVLAGVDKFKVCVAYEYKGQTLTMAYPGLDLSLVKPIYEEVAGFSEDFSTISPQLQNYLSMIEKFVEIPIGILAYGPERSQIKFLKDYL